MIRGVELKELRERVKHYSANSVTDYREVYPVEVRFTGDKKKTVIQDINDWPTGNWAADICGVSEAPTFLRRLDAREDVIAACRRMINASPSVKAALHKLDTLPQ